MGLTRTLALALAVATLPGCQRIQEAIEQRVHKDDDSTADASDAANQVPRTEEELLSDKLDVYIACVNRSAKRILDTWDKYADYIKVDVGTPKKRGTKPFVYKLGAELAPCRRAMEDGPKLQPSLPEVEKAMAEYLASAESVAKTTRELHDYYEDEAYKEDDFAKGKELAPGFKAAFERWDESRRALRTAIERKKEEADLKVLALVEQRKGKALNYFTKSFMIKARVYKRCVDFEGAKAADCGDALAGLDGAHEAFRAYHDAHPQEAEAVFWMSAFERTVTDYQAQAAAHAEALRKHPPGKKGPHKTTAAAYNRLAREYNDLTTAYNNLRFDFP